MSDEMTTKGKKEKKQKEKKKRKTRPPDEEVELGHGSTDVEGHRPSGRGASVEVEQVTDARRDVVVVVGVPIVPILLLLLAVVVVVVVIVTALHIVP
jgi:hypothetical protein